MSFVGHFKNKKILVTGNTGFKGSWLSLWLHILGAKIIGVSKDVPTIPSHYKLNNKFYLKNEKFDLSNKTRGIYFVTIISGEKLINYKIVLQ